MSLSIAGSVSSYILSSHCQGNQAMYSGMHIAYHRPQHLNNAWAFSNGCQYKGKQSLDSAESVLQSHAISAVQWSRQTFWPWRRLFAVHKWCYGLLQRLQSVSLCLVSEVHVLLLSFHLLLRLLSLQWQPPIFQWHLVWVCNHCILCNLKKM